MGNGVFAKSEMNEVSVHNDMIGLQKSGSSFAEPFEISNPAVSGVGHHGQLLIGTTVSGAAKATYASSATV